MTEATRELSSEYPVCELRAESQTSDTFEIIGYDLYALNFDSFDNKSSLDITENILNERVLFIEINIQDKEGNHLINLNNDLINYFTKEQSIKSLNELVGLKFNLSFDSENMVIIEDSVKTESYKKDNRKIISHNRFINKYKIMDIMYKDDYFEEIESKFQELYYRNNYVGYGKIIDYKHNTDENITTITVRKEEHTIDFELDYPEVYDENHPTIEFVNKVGGGSVPGLENEDVELVQASDIDNPPAVKNSISIKAKNTQNEQNTPDNTKMYNIRVLKELLTMFSLFLVFVGIFMGEFILTLLSFTVFYFTMMLRKFLNTYRYNTR